MMEPKISVIVAAFQAGPFILDAIGSALVQSVPLEIVVAPDEPASATDYAGLAGRDSRIIVLPPVTAPTGPGPARNRALEVARGDFVALLDADDLWSAGYLARLLPLAEQRGAAFGRTSITTWSGDEIRTVAPRGDVADFTTFDTAFASFHGLARRGPSRRWQGELAEDVLFDLESLALAGGTAPFAADAVYILRQNSASMTRGHSFKRDIAAGYQRLIDLVMGGASAVPPEHRARVAGVFRQWAAMNARFVAAGGENYQSFVTKFLKLQAQEQSPNDRTSLSQNDAQ